MDVHSERPDVGLFAYLLAFVDGGLARRKMLSFLLPAAALFAAAANASPYPIPQTGSSTGSNSTEPCGQVARAVNSQVAAGLSSADVRAFIDPDLALQCMSIPLDLLYILGSH